MHLLWILATLRASHLCRFFRTRDILIFAGILDALVANQPLAEVALLGIGDDVAADQASEVENLLLKDLESCRIAIKI